MNIRFSLFLSKLLIYFVFLFDKLFRVCLGVEQPQCPGVIQHRDADGEQLEFLSSWQCQFGGNQHEHSEDHPGWQWNWKARVRQDDPRQQRGT